MSEQSTDMVPLVSVSVRRDGGKVDVFDARRAMIRSYVLKKGPGKMCGECAFAVEKTICDAVGSGGCGCFLERDHRPRCGGIRI